jgi:hypothetical protein
MSVALSSARKRGVVDRTDDVNPHGKAAAQAARVEALGLADAAVIAHIGGRVCGKGAENPHQASENAATSELPPLSEDVMR